MNGPGVIESVTVPAGEWQGIEVSPLLGWATDPWMMSYNNFVSELHSIIWAFFILFWVAVSTGLYEQVDDES